MVLVLFVFQISFGQTNGAKEILGQIFEQSTSVVGVNSINNTTKVSAVSDENGRFSIVVKEGDILVFSLVNFKLLHHKVTVEDLG